MKRVIGVIPARYASTRFPGKLLAMLAGKPLIQWVVERCREAGRLDEVLVATDDERIVEAVHAIGGEAVMTRADHPSGTDRIAEAIQGREADVVVNIQGDEPMVEPAIIDQLAEVLVADGSWDMSTACTPLHDIREVNSPHVVKVVFDQNHRALYFSRSPIPFDRDGEGKTEGLYWRHLGLYGYQRAWLETIVATPPTALEETEKLEQLRALHLGCNMVVLETRDTGIGVDTPGDLETAEALMKEAGLR